MYPCHQGTSLSPYSGHGSPDTCLSTSRSYATLLVLLKLYQVAKTYHNKNIIGEHNLHYGYEPLISGDDLIIDLYNANSTASYLANKDVLQPGQGR